jgi:hypothetical protein
MTDEALVGGVDAPAEAPALELEQVRLPNPIQATMPEKPVPEAKPAPKPEAKLTPSEAIRRAQEQVKAKEAAKAEKPKAEEPKPDKARDEATGKFAPKQPVAATQDAQQAPVAQPAAPKPYDPLQPHRDAPSRFSPDAKAAWEAAPEPVKAEIHRAVRELEQGVQKYKADAEAFETVRKYHDIARQNGGSLDKSLAKVLDFEETFARDPMAGFQKVADHFGISMHAVAAHVLNQHPDEARYGQEQTIASLRQELSSLKQELSGIKPIVQEYKTSSDEKTLAEWAADKPHFSDLRAEVTEYVRQGIDPDTAYRKAVDDAVEKARRFGFAPIQNQTASSAVETQPQPLNPAGQKSITGAPVTGSNPTGRKSPPPSIREAIKQASARHG